MKKRALILLAACAVIFFASQSGAQTTTTSVMPSAVDKCADLQGTWTFTYNGDATDTVTFTDICSKESGPSATPECMPGPGGPRNAWLCVAHGTRTSNGQVVQIRRISYDVAGTYVYYEATDAEIIAAGQDQSFDTIPIATFLECSLAADAANYGLKSGVKTGCTEPTTTTTIATTTTTSVAGPCPAQKVLGEDNPELDSLRALRDGPLAQSAIGRKLTRIYYANAEGINSALDSSPALWSFARKVFQAAAGIMK